MVLVLPADVLAVRIRVQAERVDDVGGCLPIDDAGHSAFRIEPAEGRGPFPEETRPAASGPFDHDRPDAVFSEYAYQVIPATLDGVLEFGLEPNMRYTEIIRCQGFSPGGLVVTSASGVPSEPHGRP